MSVGDSSLAGSTLQACNPIGIVVRARNAKSLEIPALAGKLGTIMMRP